MGAFDRVLAGLSLVGFGLLAYLTPFGETDYHTNAAQLEAQLETRASAALAEARMDWAQVELNGQHAKILGTPPNEASAETAKQAVLRSTGPGGWLMGGVVSVEFAAADASVTDAPLETVSPYVWRAVKSDASSVMLVGHAPSEAVQGFLLSSAQALSPSVTDRTTLAAGAPGDAAWAETAQFGLEQVMLLDAGEARLTDMTLRVSGVAMDDAVRIQVGAAVANLKAPWVGVSRVRGPSHWQADHKGGQLVLSGRIETEADREEIASIAQTYFDGEVVDVMEVAGSETDDWVVVAKAGLPQFSKFDSGVMAYDAKQEGFIFEGEASPSTLQFLREDITRLGDGFTLDIAADIVETEVEELVGVDLGTDPLIVCQASFDLVMASNRVLFETDSAVISRESGLALDKIAAISGKCADELSFEITGHTDSVGDPALNVTLSEARAQAVANYLVGSGIDGSRLMVKGYGSDVPRADNETAEGRAANRRIEFNVQEWSE